MGRETTVLTAQMNDYHVYAWCTESVTLTLVRNDALSNAAGGDGMTGLNVTVKDSGVNLQELAYQYITNISVNVSGG